MTIDTNIAASPEPSTETEDFAQRVRVNHTKLTSELKSHYDFLVCGSGSSVVARRLAENPDVSILLFEAGVHQSGQELEHFLENDHLEWVCRLASGGRQTESRWNVTARAGAIV